MEVGIILWCKVVEVIGYDIEEVDCENVVDVVCVMGFGLCYCMSLGEM